MARVRQRARWCDSATPKGGGGGGGGGGGASLYGASAAATAARQGSAREDNARGYVVAGGGVGAWSGQPGQDVRMWKVTCADTRRPRPAAVPTAHTPTPSRHNQTSWSGRPLSARLGHGNTASTSPARRAEGGMGLGVHVRVPAQTASPEDGARACVHNCQGAQSPHVPRLAPDAGEAVESSERCGGATQQAAGHMRRWHARATPALRSDTHHKAPDRVSRCGTVTKHAHKRNTSTLMPSSATRTTRSICLKKPESHLKKPA